METTNTTKARRYIGFEKGIRYELSPDAEDNRALIGKHCVMTEGGRRHSGRVVGTESFEGGNLVLVDAMLTVELIGLGTRSVPPFAVTVSR